jgi:hypothetical protein
MVKADKSNPIPEKKAVEAPAVVHSNLMELTQQAYDKGMMKYNRIECVSSPYLITKAYLDNYDSIFGHE